MRDSSNLPDEFYKELETHRKIKLSLWSSIKTFLERILMNACDGALYCACFGVERKGSKLYKLYEAGTDKLEE